MESCRLFPSLCGKKETNESETLWWKVLDMVDLENEIVRIYPCISANPRYSEHSYLWPFSSPGSAGEGPAVFRTAVCWGVFLGAVGCLSSSEPCSLSSRAVSTGVWHFHKSHERYPLQAPWCVLRHILSIQESFGIRLRMRLWPFQNYEATAWKAKDCVSVLLRKLSIISEESVLWMQYCLAKSAVSHLHVLLAQVSSQNVISLPHYICSWGKNDN